MPVVRLSYKKACAPRKSRTNRVTTRLLSTSCTQQELLRVLTLSKGSCIILGILYSVILHVELCLVCLLSSIWTYVLLPVKWLLHHSTHPLLFFNKDYTKSCAFVSFHWSAPGGYCDPERSRRSPASAECNPHQERAQCTNRTPMNNCCHPLR